MHCPADSTQLRLVEVDGVSIDVCPECFRGWFDFGEYQELLPEASRQMSADQVRLTCPLCLTYLLKVGEPWSGSLGCASCRGMLIQLPPDLVEVRRAGQFKALLGVLALAADLVRIAE